MKHISYLLLATLVILIGLCGCDMPESGSNNPSAPTPVGTTTASSTSVSTPTPTPPAFTTPDTSGVSQVITLYYDAIKAQNYPLAYTYLDANAIDASGHRITLRIFEQMAQAMESDGGPVASFSVAVFLPSAILSVTRTLLVYHAHLQMKQEDQTWKIASLDRI